MGRNLTERSGGGYLLSVRLNSLSVIDYGQMLVIRCVEHEALALRCGGGAVLERLGERETFRTILPVDPGHAPEGCTLPTAQ